LDTGRFALLRGHRKRQDREGRPYDKYLVIVYNEKTGQYKAVTVDTTGPKTVASITVRGHRYAVDRDRAFMLKGWNPFIRQHRVTPIESMQAERIGVIIHQEVENPLHAVEIAQPAIDRLTDRMKAVEEISPVIQTALGDNPLYRRYQRHTNFGMTVDLKIMTILFGALGIFLFILWYSGWFNS